MLTDFKHQKFSRSSKNKYMKKSKASWVQTATHNKLVK